MKNLFITATDTNVGKTTISKWLCYHLGYSYFKPIQTGTEEGKDLDVLESFTSKKMHPSTFEYKAPLCPYHAANLEEKFCDPTKIFLPQESNLIVEGAGGIFVPIHERYMIVDLIQDLKLPVIVVTRSTLGTLNHTLLTLEALSNRKIPFLGLIMSGPKNEHNKDTLEKVGQTKVLDQLEYLDDEMLKTRKPSTLLFDVLNAYELA